MTCPDCGVTDEPVAAIRGVSICAGCGASVFTDSAGITRKSRFSDVEDFDLAEMAQLRRARASIARPIRPQL